MADHDALLTTIYADEKEPDSKQPVPAKTDGKDEEKAEDMTVAIAEGVPLLPHPAPTDGSSSSSPWRTSLFACLGSNDEFFSSDLEVCVLGSCAPCLLYATNVERLQPTTENTFTNHLLSYSGLLCLGNILFGFNALAPCFTSPFRTELRRRYNLMGSGECFTRACGCGTCFTQSANAECMEMAGDFATHYFCHPCALCQEGREIRRRTSHPGFVRSYIPMEAPNQQIMRS